MAEQEVRSLESKEAEGLIRGVRKAKIEEERQ
jgi:hypothetical protein